MRISDWSSDVCSSDLSLLALSRQNLPQLRTEAAENRSARGAYRLKAAEAPRKVVLIASGSEVPLALKTEIGRASCRERVCQYVLISVVAVALKKKNK